MRAIIPVAGVGSRLRPHTFTIPKVLLNVAGKPILGHILDTIIRDGVDEATIIVGQMGDKIKEYVRANYRITVDFVEQPEARGLAHAIYLARESFTRDPLLIILGDTIFDVDLKSVMSEKCTSIGVKQVEDPRRFGVVELHEGFVKRMVEKPEHPPSNSAIVGLYWICNPPLLGDCIDALFHQGQTTRGEYQLTDALQLMVERGEKIRTFNVDGWFDCGKPETLLATNRHLLGKLPVPSAIKNVVIIPPAYISRNAKIKNSVIGPYATIADGTIIEDSVVRNSIVSEKAEIHTVLLDSSLVGNNTTVIGQFNRINIGDSSEIELH